MTDNEKSKAAALLGSVRTPKKAAACRANGLKGGDGRKWFLILSGEGESGTWSAHYTTRKGLRSRVKKEMAGGDRWASGWELMHVTTNGEIAVSNVDNQTMRGLDKAGIVALGVPESVLDALKP